MERRLDDKLKHQLIKTYWIQNTDHVNVNINIDLVIILG